MLDIEFCVADNTINKGISKMDRIRTGKAAGELDPGFGDAGKLVYRVTGATHFSGAALLQDDARILIAGAEAGGEVVILRCLPNGQLDPEFGDEGQVNISLGTGISATTARPAIQPDGKILVHGDLEGEMIFVVRCAADGTVDTRFGNNGVVLIDLFQSAERFRALVVQSDGKIVLSGESWRAYDDYDAILIRLTASGQLDPGFGGTGIIRTFRMGYGPLLNLPDGRLLVGGRAKNALLFECYLPDGQLDKQFGNAGALVVEVESASYSEVAGLTLQDDGSIVAAGSAGIDSQLFPLVIRILSTGQVDNSFNHGLPVLDSFDGYEVQNFAVAVQPDGKILAAGGSTGTPDTSNFTLMRILPSGRLDMEFGSDARVMTDLGGFDSVSNVFVQPNGQILLGGRVIDFDKGNGVGVARYMGS
ncbi:hypothetical protein [Pseudomonas sp. ICMP 561]|uniref:hypothetical protein n=1 Tax=Pseudomonas sp. ICMP 561 TaxID=1718918 RepID=UPI001145B5CC|nr:hypothetical protein [Pseudomonas sp. ICMP 561]